ncbi:MAG TPA: DNA ligase D [Burkholderiales bacterium]|nr:DNA ligase D [Burkholderiales bacterium]
MADRLERYREMRDFSATPEPRGQRTLSKKSGLRYYIQRHDATRLHYDFRLELDGVLKSWAVPKGPSLDPKDKRLAVQTEDHPLDYGEFEGTIPEKQYGAGDVLLWDRGGWAPEDADPRAALRKGRLHFRLEGEKLRGSWVLTRIRNSKDWLLIKRNDESATSDVDIVAARPESVKRAPKKARRAKKAEALPAFVTPQLATLVTQPPRGGDWLYEVKHDGYRMLARISGEVRLFTRSGNDWTGKLPHLVKAIEQLDLNDTWLDGEIVVPGEDGRASFQALQNAFDAGADAKIVYYVFDAPFLDGKDMRQLPLRERKSRLKKALKSGRHVRFSDDLTGSAQEVLEHACKLRLEGLIGKQADAVYQAGRTRSWIKLKCRLRQDFVIAGYTAPKGSRSGFGALVVGVYEKPRKLVYAGKVGTGFDEDMLASLMKRFAELKTKDSALENPPRERGITWLRPKLVAEVEFAERTDEGLIRQGAFMGLRQDISAKAVGAERAQEPPGEIRISHPQRVIYPGLGFTKGDLARYYAEVADWMLPHAANRPLTLVRCPDGAEKPCFYQRHLGMGASPGELKQIERLRSSKGKYLYLDSRNGILSAVQNGAVEFHTWGASVPDIRHPDRITMDLDPGPGISWADLVRGTELTRTLLEKLGLKCFLKTTGGKGLHVVAPLEPELEWDRVKEFTRLVAEFLVKAEPALFTAKISKGKREGRIFVDYLRNSETASAVCAYSARARRDAGVSTPLEWDELGRSDLRERFTVLTVPKRLVKLTLDPWAEYSSTRQSITDAMWRALKT